MWEGHWVSNAIPVQMLFHGTKNLKKMNKENNHPGKKFFNPEEYKTIFIHSQEDASQGKPEKLIELLTERENNAVKNEILKLLKEKSALPVLIEAIAAAEDVAGKQILTAACWEADIDCSNYLSFFTELAIKEDYIIAIEAITVIENMQGAFKTGELETAIKSVELARQKSDNEDKKPLLKELLTVLDFLLR